MKEKTLKRLKSIEDRQPDPEDAGAALDRFMARMEQIASRLRAEPDWREPTEAERQEIYRNLEAAIPGITARMAAARKEANE
jgi:hypothetical protein